VVLDDSSRVGLSRLRAGGLICDFVFSWLLPAHAFLQLRQPPVDAVAAD
jgi:hypothetical protein